MSRQLIITGVQYGGLVTAAQELYEAGLFLGDEMVPPSAADHDGAYEDPVIVRMHEQLLTFNSTDWRYTGEALKQIPADCLDKVKQRIESYNSRHPQWGFKDPRAALFLPLWHSLLEEPYTLIIYRHYLESIESLLHHQSRHFLNRYDPAALRFWKEPDLAYRIWLAYHRKLLRHLRKHPERTLLLSHHALLRGVSVSSLLRDRFGFNWETIPGERNNPRENHTHIDIPPPTDPALRKELDTLWHTLQELSIAPAPSEPEEKAPSAPESPEQTIRLLLKRLVGPPVETDVITRLQNLLDDPSVPLQTKISSVRSHLTTLHAIGRESIAIDTLKKLEPVGEAEQEALTLLLGELHLLAGRKEEAEDYYHRFFSRLPEPRPIHYHKLAEFRLRCGVFDEAESLLEQTLQRNPNFPALHMLRAELLARRCNFREALQALDQTLAHKDAPLFRIGVLFRQIEYAKVLGDETLLWKIVSAIRQECDRLPQTPPHIVEKLKSVQEEHRKGSEPKQETPWIDQSKLFLSTQERGMLLLHMLEGISHPAMRKDLTRRLSRHLEELLQLNILHQPEIRYYPLPLSVASRSPLHHLRLAAVVHLYYLDLFDELFDYLERIRPRPDLYLTIHPDGDPREIAQRLYERGYPYVEVRRLRNRGRDIAPFLIDFGPTLLSYDLCCKIHSKKSLDFGEEKPSWRTHLLENLLGTSGHVADILHRFVEDPNLGLLFPDAHFGLPHHGFSWTESERLLPDLLERLSLTPLRPLLHRKRIDFPTGSMFWFRPQAIRQLLDSPLDYEDFAPEPIPPDGTTAHAVERLIAYVTRFNGYDFIEINREKNRYSINQTHKNYLFE